MPFKPFAVTLVLFVLTAQLSYADTFIVTSNADNGPGTLRDAIDKANANGTTVTDYIHFNIAQPTYNLRIIELLTELPALSSNLVIDGSTQPGATYGTTDAKICLRKTTYSPTFSMLKIENAQNVQLYGMHLFYGYWQGLFGGPIRSNQLYGVNIINSSDITIGEAGKGNVINGVVHGIYSNSDNCFNIKVRANYLGHTAFYSNPTDDIDDVILVSECAITLANVKDIYIGGAQPADANIFGTTKRAISIDSKNETGNGLIRIQYNLFGRKYDKVSIVAAYDFWDRYINIGRTRNGPVNWTLAGAPDYRVELLDNDIPNDASIHDISDSVIVLRNNFVYDNRTHGGKLLVGTTRGGVIGGDNPANANNFLYKKPGFGGNSVVVYDGGPVTMLKNIFICNSSVGSTTWVLNTYGKVPFAQVDATTTTSVSGRATPDARIDLYYDDECSACEGKVFIATLQATSAGTWSWSGPVTGTVIATATKNGYTSMFSAPTFDWNARKIKHPVCGLKNGSITGITTEGAESYFWIELRSGDTASKTQDLLNAGPGEYLMYAVHGGTCIMSLGQSIVLEDVTPVITVSPTITHPGCGLSNGMLTGLRVSGVQYSKLEWKNELGQVISSQLDLYQLPPGKYTFYATDQTVGCTAISATFELINQNGPSLDIAALQTTHTTCGAANGSIKGLAASNVTGTPFLQWVNAANQPVGTDFDLVNVPAGTYRFKFKDQGACDTIIRPFTINALTTFNPIIVTSFTAKDGLCDLPEASVRINTFSANEAAYTFHWVNAASGTPAGNGTTLTNMPAGTYQLIATDNNNCEAKIFTTTLKVAPKPTFDYTATKITDDQCNAQEGAISSIKVNGLVASPSYAWFDQNNTQVGGNTLSLQKLPAGTYYLQVTDGGTCMVQSKPFTVANTNRSLPAPSYDEIIIPRNTGATLTVRNPSKGDYKLFTDAVGSALSQQNQTGNFTIPPLSSDMTLYVQQSTGTCFSPMSPVPIKVVDRSFFTTPNAFTPNHDSNNDRLTVRIKGYIQLSYFRIYNRWGQLIFETTKVNDGWDGTMGGALQQTGTYIWSAEGKDLLGNLIKNKGSFVLIR